MSGINEAIKQVLENDPLFIKRPFDGETLEEPKTAGAIVHKCPMCNKEKTFYPLVSGTGEFPVTVDQDGNEVLHCKYQCSSCGTVVDFGIEVNAEERWLKKIQSSITFEMPDF